MVSWNTQIPTCTGSWNILFSSNFKYLAKSFLESKPETAVGDNCYEKNTDYCCKSNNSIDAINDENLGSAKKCQEHCQNNDNCFFWTYFDPAYKGDEGANMCYLRAKKGAVKSIEHATSGAKKCEGMNFKDFLKTNW